MENDRNFRSAAILFFFFSFSRMKSKVLRSVGKDFPGSVRNIVWVFERCRIIYQPGVITVVQKYRRNICIQSAGAFVWRNEFQKRYTRRGDSRYIFVRHWREISRFLSRNFTRKRVPFIETRSVKYTRIEVVLKATCVDIHTGLEVDTCDRSKKRRR